MDGRLGPNHEACIELDRQESEVKRQLDAEVTQRGRRRCAPRYERRCARESRLREKLESQEQEALGLRDSARATTS